MSLGTPLARGLRHGTVALVVVLAAALAAEEAVRRRDAARAQGRAAALADAAGGVAEEWLAARRRVTRLLVDQVEDRLLDDGDLRPSRAALERLHRTYPDALRAAVLVDGQGRVVASGEGWREGTVPDWLGVGDGTSGVSWIGPAVSGRFVAREAMVAPAGLEPPLWLVTGWEPADLADALARVLSPAPSAVGSLEMPSGEKVLRVPALGAGPEDGREAVAAVGPSGLRLRVRVPGPAPRSAWPWVVAGTVAMGIAAMAARGRARMADVDRRLRAAVERAGRGEGPPDAALAHHLPESVHALQAFRRHGAAQAAGSDAVAALRDRLRGAAVLVTDATGKVEFVAGDVTGVLGVPPEEVQGSLLRRLLAPGGWETLAPMLARAALQGDGMVAEVDRARQREGCSLVEVTIAGRGERGGYVLLVRDAAEGRDLRERLQAAEARYRALVERMHDGLAVVGEGRIEAANRALATLLGLSVEELQGTPLKSHVAASDLLVLVDHLRDLPSGGTTFDLRLVRSDALETIQTRVAASPLDDGNALLVFRDEDERRRAEQLLLRANRRLDATLDATSDAILALEPTPDGDRVVFANRAFADLVGMTSEDLLRRTGDDAVAGLLSRGVVPETFRSWIADLRRLPGARRSERFDSPAEPRRTFEVRGAPLEFPEGTGRVLSFRDVTAEADAARRLRRDHEVAEARREVLEEANRESERVNRDLEARTEELDRVNQRLKQLDEMRSNLLANVSHELQTPLVSIRGYTEMILKEKIGPVTDEQGRGLRISLKNIDRLIALIDNLLEFSRAEGRLTELRLSTFHLKELIAETIDLMRDVAARRLVRLQVNYAGGDPVLRGDRDGIGQVLLNLVSNAIKFNREGGEVVIELGSPRRGFAPVHVRDTGPGIAAGDLEHIFDRYYRAEGPGGREVEGSGLGLAIVRQILRMHGCTIHATSPPEGGAVFSFTLPLARESDGPVPGPTRRRSSSSTPGR